MRRAAAAAAFAGALLLSLDAGAQGILELFGPDQPDRASRRAPRPARDIPRAERPRAEKNKPEAKAKKRDAAAPDAAAKADPKNAEAPPPPYEGQMTRLSEVLGALSFLRNLCGAGDGDDWRTKMSALLDAEAPEGPRRARFVAAYNRGFHGFEFTYRVCTPNAKAATGRYLAEAASISKDVTYRFGSP
ncbi:MAG: TIGR02301 family protein [Methylocystis sp.]|nr:MAG: TIGR02301 family protein [Methylocystis sp.]